MNISLRQLQVFLAVARHRHFSRAGESIGLTQPAVSRCIRELEAELAVRLLDRTTRDVELTTVGVRLSSQLARVLDELQDVLLEARKQGEQTQGTVHIASSPTLSASLMPTLLSACAEHYPQVRLVMHDQVQRLNIDQVRSGEVDFGLVVQPGLAEDLICEPVLDDAFWLVCRQDHPLARLPEVTWQQLEGQALVLLDYNSGSRPLIDQILAEHGVRVSVAQELGHSASVFRLVQAGVGVSVSPGLALPFPAGSALVAVSLVPVARRTIMLIRRRNRSLYPVAEKLWQLVKTLQPQLQACASLYPATGEVDAPSADS